MDRFTLIANTLAKTVKNIRADRIEIEIGDSKQLDFKPQFKIKRWDNEVNFSMRAVEEAGATMVEEEGKIKYKGKDIEVHQYEKPEAGEDGGFEFEWVLNKKPKSNVLRTTIQHKGLDFFYQPALTAEEIEQGASRSENVVGSYAVYHKTNKSNAVGGMEYRAGKAFHIYRPHAVDSDGITVWCGLAITEGELTVTVPEDFLNKASYPVVVDPTFGYTSAGGSSYSSILLGGNLATNPVYSEVESISVYFTNNRSHIFTFGINNGSANSVLSNIQNSNSVTESAVGWVTGTLSSPAVISAGDYWLIGQDNNTSDWAYDSGGSSQEAVNSTSTTYDDWSGLVNPFYFSDIFSIYATYTAAPTYNPAFAHHRLLL